MITVRRRFIWFGDFEIDHVACDVCGGSLYGEDLDVAIREIDFDKRRGLKGSPTAYHTGCKGLEKFADAAKAHLTSFAFVSGWHLEIPEWQEVTYAKNRLLRYLPCFFFDWADKKIRCVSNCTTCRTVALITLEPNDALKPASYQFYAVGDSQPQFAPPRVCMQPKVEPSGCFHDFIEIAHSGLNGALPRVRPEDELKKEIRDGYYRYDAEMMRIMGTTFQDILFAKCEHSRGYRWHWCSKCGYLIQQASFDKASDLPRQGVSKQTYTRYGTSFSVSQERDVGSSFCLVCLDQSEMPSQSFDDALGSPRD